MSASSRTSVLLVAVLVPLVAAAAVFAVVLFAQYRQAQTAVVEDLMEDTWRTAQPLRDAAGHVRDHARTLASVAATLYATVPAAAGSALVDLWQREIAAEPLYDQLRLIGPPEAPRELIRFNRIDGHIERVAAGMLQDKGGRGYYRRAAGLAPGRVDLSITLNREFGRIEPDRPMLRAAAPVYRDGSVAAVVVINVDFGRLLEHLQADRVPAQSRLYIADTAGYWLAHPDPARTFGFDREGGGTVAEDFPGLPEALRSLAPGETWVGRRGEGWLVAQRIALNRDGSMPVDVMLVRGAVDMAPVLSAGLAWALLVTLPLMGLAGVVALVLRHRFVAPLLTVARWADWVETGRYELGPHPRGAAEVRAFAAKFAAMAARLGRREGELQRRNQELEALFRAVPSPVLMVGGLDHHGLLGNPAAERLFGAPAADGDLAPTVELLRDGTPLAREQWPWNRAWRSGEPVRGEALTLRQPLRPPRQLLADAAPLFDAARRARGAVAVVADVSERAAFEQSLLVANRRLTRLNAELEQFARAASHDLKEPLRGVAHLAGLFEEHYGGQLDATGRDWLALLRRRVMRMHRLLDGLLAFTAADGGGEPAQAVDSAALVQEIVAGLQPPAGMQVTAAAGLPRLRSRREALRSALRQLLENAVRHHDRPHEGHVTVGAERADGGWRFWVEDDGPGIPAHARAQVFRMFYTLAGDREGGRGVGLALVAKLAAEQGGSAGVEAVTPRGSRFWLLWPDTGPDPEEA